MWSRADPGETLSQEESQSASLQPAQHESDQWTQQPHVAGPRVSGDSVGECDHGDAGGECGGGSTEQAAGRDIQAEGGQTGTAQTERGSAERSEKVRDQPDALIDARIDPDTLSAQCLFCASQIVHLIMQEMQICSKKFNHHKVVSAENDPFQQSIQPFIKSISSLLIKYC